ncbi:DNA internalization-related competence protein ComEC/Rec2 [Ornithinibacillus salinisoli]|uniref:DNA internalization-related competence protein ComEC/Rec2 n=1 Tax=Ornithinibacillus salinisoli TaxID=1848459 RepID=A0ABW4W726_9BACI
MKGKWYIAAISIAISVLTIHLDNKYFFVGLVVWLLILYFMKRLGKIPVLVSLTLSLFFIFYIPPLNETSHEIPPKNIEVTGEITSPIEMKEQYINFRFKEASTKQSILITIFPDQIVTNEESAMLLHGATCRVFGSLGLPDKSSNPGQFDYRSYLATQGITYQLIVESIEDISCQGSSPFISKIFQWKVLLQEGLSELYSTETYAWINALVLGNDDFIAEDTIEIFRKWGLSHLLAISGLHIGLVVALIYFVLIKLSILTKEKAQWTITFVLPLYALLAGGQPSVWRASLMVLMIVLLSKLKRVYSSIDIISMVFILLIIFDKYIVYHIGFQLSFLVTFTILLSREWLLETQSLFFQMLKISFISQIVIIPLQFLYFSSVQPLAILLNVIVVPYFSFFVIPFMFILVFFSLFPFVAKIFDQLFIFVHEKLFVSFLEVIDHYVYFPWINGSFPLSIAVVFYALVLLMMKNIQLHKSMLAFRYGVLLTVLIMYVICRPYFSPNGSVTMLDIGQGDAIVIELPYREGVILIDAGANFTFDQMEPGEKVFTQIIKPFLHTKGIVKLDAIFISHEDVDHYGSVGYLLEEFIVEQIFISPYFELPPSELLTWKKLGTEINRVQKGEEVIVGEKSFYVLEPSENKGSSNENSLVIYSEFGGQNWLFTGDIGKITEENMMKNYPELVVDILKVAHHGSHSSTDKYFIETIEPDYALISVGKNNRYGHPAKEVLQTLEEADVTILRTDLDGAVFFHFGHESGTFYKYVP